MANEYCNMCALDALKFVKNRNMLLPDIQREYVWDTTDIEKLFESIVDDYPVGSCIFWKTNKKVLNDEKPNLYYFISKYKQGVTKNEKAPEFVSDETNYYIVLDGQQRITSLNIALFGSFTSKKKGKGYSVKNSKSWVERELYYNLSFYDSNELDDENPIKRFVFLSEEEAKNGNYYKVKQIVKSDNLTDYVDTISNFKKNVKTDLMCLYRRIMEEPATSVIHYYCIAENTYDEALDIFVRVNSTGRKLSKSDLLFSTLIDGWKEGKENIDTLLSDLNSAGDGFSFTKDYLMRLALVLVDANTNLKINSLTSKTINEIRDNWQKIKKALEKLSELLVSIGMCDENMTSYNATIPLAYYFYKGGKIDTAESKKEAKKFLAVSMSKGLFGVASNDSLNQSRTALKSVNEKTPFSLTLFSSITLTGNRTFTASKDDIEYWLTKFEKGKNTFIILSLLYPNLKLSQVEFHQDHCHPYTLFDDKNIKKLGLTEDKIKEWQFKRNLIPNLQFLEGKENESKNKTPLSDWVKKGNTFEYIPENVSLELSNFDEFFNKRKSLIKNKLLDIFGLEANQK